MSFARIRENDGTHSGLEVNHAAAIIVLLAFAFLLLVRRGFRGFSVPGVGAVRVA